MADILKLSPTFKDYIWGSNKLKKEYDVSGMERVAEAWVLSAHPDGPSYLSDGRSFIDELNTMGLSALGEKYKNFTEFPQLIKLIDAQNDLSVQVHPSDEYALAHEGQFGKTEMWYILEAEEGAGIYYGFERDVTCEEVKSHICDNTLVDLLRFIPVKRGECYFIPAGTVHAIGKGLLIAEIQQNSNVTYRLYDYGRKDAAGNTRPLHIDKALAVMNLSRSAKQSQGRTLSVKGSTFTEIAECPYFRVEKMTVTDTITFADESAFASLLILSGEGTINGQPFERYDAFFIPANSGKVTLVGCFEALLSRL